MELNEFGQIAFDEWVKLPDRFHNMELDVFQIMPNHMHGIFSLTKSIDNAGATLAVAQKNETVVPNDKSVVPNDKSVVPNDKSVAPNDKSVVPNDKSVAPNDKSVAPNDKSVAPDTKSEIGAGASPAPTVGDIVGAYKSLVANDCLDIYKSNNEMMGKLWQRNYHDSIIRNEKSYRKIVNYIRTNPAYWKNDRFHKY